MEYVSLFLNQSMLCYFPANHKKRSILNYKNVRQKEQQRKKWIVICAWKILSIIGIIFGFVVNISEYLPSSILGFTEE